MQRQDLLGFLARAVFIYFLHHATSAAAAAAAVTADERLERQADRRTDGVAGRNK